MRNPPGSIELQQNGTDPPGSGSPATRHSRRQARRPVVERIAGWSARHAAVALIGWLLLVISAVAIGQLLGTKNINSYDPGESGRAERVLSQPGVVQPPTETVLVQPRAAGRTV